MKSAREAILSALSATRPAFPRRDRRFEIPGLPPDPIGVLRARVEAAGGRFQQLPRRDWPSRVEWPSEAMAAAAAVPPPQAASVAANPEPAAARARVYSALPELTSRVTADTEPDRADFTQLDLCVLRGEFAVVENGAVWHVPRSPLERRAALLAEHLVVVIEGDALVATLHQAYERIALETLSFGWFLCGPSKTADIEQSLVLGAHGPRSMRLVWLRDEPEAGAAHPT
jgi:L-lactate utilization protein LutC